MERWEGDGEMRSESARNGGSGWCDCQLWIAVAIGLRANRLAGAASVGFEA